MSTRAYGSMDRHGRSRAVHLPRHHVPAAAVKEYEADQTGRFVGRPLGKRAAHLLGLENRCIGSPSLTLATGP